MLTARAQRVYDLLNGKPGITRIEGQTETPRDIANSSSPSEHNFGNALDVYGSVDNLLFWANFLNDNRDDYDIKVLCYDPGIGRKYDVCTTKHTDHMHVDFGPHCGGVVAVGGSMGERATACNTYQGTGVPTNPYPPGTAGGFMGGITGDILGGIQQSLTTALLVGVGIALAIAGVVLVAKDTALGQTVISTAKTAATKGVVK